MALIAGKVTGNCPASARVVIYALAGGRWWVQPYADQPFTPVGTDGTWSTETHLGSIYAVLLVTADFRAEPTLSSIPAVGGPVLAVVRQEGRRSP